MNFFIYIKEPISYNLISVRHYYAVNMTEVLSVAIKMWIPAHFHDYS